MNVYDFDQTIFNPDSSYCFVRYCLRRFPRAVLPSLPQAAGKGMLCLIHQADTRSLKEQVFSFLQNLDNVEEIVSEFWSDHFSGIAPWYLRQRKPDDLIISASPEFLLRPVAEELGVSLIATRMDRYTGRIIGNNCHDAEKVCRFLREYPDVTVDTFYSDSLSDSPMAWFAREAFLVRDGQLQPWPEDPHNRNAVIPRFKRFL